MRRRVEAGRLHLLHRGVYAFGDGSVSRRGQWLGAVLACGEGALLSHGTAAALWGLARPRGSDVEVTAPAGRTMQGIVVHECAVFEEDRAVAAGIPVTSVARTLFDLAEVVDERRLEKAYEEADRLGLLQVPALEGVCARSHGRRALRPIRSLIDAARTPTDTQSPLEDRVLDLCREHDLPPPATGARVEGREVDALWPKQKLVVEADGWTTHRHRAAFERDRARDAAMQAAGYRVIRLTHQRLEREPKAIVHELRRLLAPGRARAAT